MNALKKKLRSDTDTSHYADQLTEDFCKYIITEEWGYRQTNANMENVFKTLRGYCDEQINNPIANPFTSWTRLETTKNRFTFKYGGGQTLSLIRVRNYNQANQTVLSPELGLDWPNHGFECEPNLVFTK